MNDSLSELKKKINRSIVTAKDFDHLLSVFDKNGFKKSASRILQKYQPTSFT